LRRPLVAGNWKMNHTLGPARALVRRLVEAGLPRNADVAVFPPFVWLVDLVEEARGSHLAVGAQNCHFADSGAYTGEVAAPMLKDLGATHVILGHSERRQYFSEDDALVLAKARAALKHGLTPVICIGETLQEREAERTFERVGAQLAQGIEPLGDELTRVVVAYEPVWAIGTGRNATPEQAQEVHAFIRARLAQALPAAAGVRILYGGSVKPDNASALLARPDIDGFLVGGASLTFEAFHPIIEAADRRPAGTAGHS
jgi:triosephosphate isomerase (TIM)